MSDPKTAEQLNMGLTGQADLPEIRQHIEAVKNAVSAPESIVRFMIEDLMTFGDCFVHLTTKRVIPVGTLTWHYGIVENDPGHYEQVMNSKVIASIPAKKILHLRRVVH